MRKLLYLLLASVVVLGSSCAATWYKAPATIVTASLNDNFGTCGTPIPILVPDTTHVTVHLRLTQGTFAWEDSALVLVGTSKTFPEISVPSSGLITRQGWARGIYGLPGCPISDTKTSIATTTSPMAPVIQ